MTQETQEEKARKKAQKYADAAQEKADKAAQKLAKKQAKSTPNAELKAQGVPHLFEPITLRGVTMRNRIWLPPMDMYSVYAHDGKPTSFHYQHYVSRALGGFGAIITEATAVSAEGRISPEDVGLWNDEQVGAWAWIVDGIKQAGAVPGVQLCHAGRKGSSGTSTIGRPGAYVPPEEGGWEVAGPSPIAYSDRFVAPREMTLDDIHLVVEEFKQAAIRARTAGFQLIEVHAAHGYLLSQFLDSHSNQRIDEYGGSFENRIRLTVEVVDAIRTVWPEDLPLLVRVSATDWAEEPGWDLDQTIELASILKEHGVDMIDVSTGAIVSGVKIPAAPNYQVPFAQAVRKNADIPVTTVGVITEPQQAEKILAKGKADVVEIGRAALREPAWPLRAAYELGLDRNQAPYATAYKRGAWGTRR